MIQKMNLARMILREIQHSKVNTVSCFLVVVIATGVFVAMVGISQASIDKTRVLMKDMGFNLLITPQGIDPARYQALDFQEVDMPEDNISKLASSAGIMAQHFVGKLQRTVQIEGCTAVLTGVLAESLRHGTQKQPMPTAYTVPQGQVFLGSAVARALKKDAGSEITILGKPFKIGRILDESGVMPDDIRVYAHLHDAQELLGKSGRINAIDALACQCPASVKDIIAALKANIESVLPNIDVQPYYSILLARHQQRVMMQRLEMAAAVIVMLASAAAIWALTYQNVRNRRYEVGVLRALGVADWKIGGLFVGKILLFSVTGTLLGCFAGLVAGDYFKIAHAEAFVPSSLILAVLVVTPVMTILFGLPPIISRLLQEPIDVLGEAA